MNPCALFGLGRSTVGEIVLDTCEAIAVHLMQKSVHLPSHDGLKEIKEDFEAKGFPQAIIILYCRYGAA